MGIVCRYHKRTAQQLFFFQMRMKMDVNIVRPAEIVVHTAYKKSE